MDDMTKYEKNLITCCENLDTYLKLDKYAKPLFLERMVKNTYPLLSTIENTFNLKEIQWRPKFKKTNL